MAKPEEKTRRDRIDPKLEEAGWTLQDYAKINLSASDGLAVREFRLEDRKFADYLLFLQRKAAGVVEAKPEG